MIAALSCLWGGFILGYGLAAIMSSSARADARQEAMLDRLLRECAEREQERTKAAILGKFND